MSEKKVPETEKKKHQPQELDLDDLDMVQGGSIANVQYSKTSGISSDTRDKI